MDYTSDAKPMPSANPFKKKKKAAPKAPPSLQGLQLAMKGSGQ